jgi:hypothetical protein
MKTTRLVTIMVANVDKTQDSIDAINKAIEGKPLTISDTMLLLDTIGILRGIQKGFEVAA